MADDAEWEAFMAKWGLPLRYPPDHPRIGLLSHHMNDPDTIARAKADFMWQGVLEHLERSGEWPEMEGKRVVRKKGFVVKRYLTRVQRVRPLIRP